MKITEINFYPHRLQRKFRWQTASYSADTVRVFYAMFRTDDGVIGIGAASVMPKDDATFEPDCRA